MLYLKPIINGVGNYYVESRTRNQERTDLIIDYLGEQFIIEMKIWRGNVYHEQGEKQLAEYLSIIIWIKDICSVLVSIRRKKQA